MGMLDWIKRRGGEPEDEPARSPYETDTGKPINQMWRSEWYSDDHGLQEFRHHVGRSKYGFHGGLEVSNQGGEGPFRSGRAMKTFADAQQASYGMRDGTYQEPDDKRNSRIVDSLER
jgi:hypothetical protein